MAVPCLTTETARAELQGSFRAFAPEGVWPVVDALVGAARRPTPLYFFLAVLVALWSSSATSLAILEALEDLGHEVPSGAWRRRARAFALGLAAALALALLASVAAVLPALRSLGLLGSVLAEVAEYARVARWPVAVVAFTAAPALVLRLSTVRGSLSSSAVLAGSVTTLLLSVAVTFGFALVLVVSPSAGVAGAAGAALSSLLWLYLAASALLAGAVVARAWDT